MNIDFKNNISFQKSLVAKAKIIVNGRQESAEIFHLDKNEDMVVFKKNTDNQDWENNYYLADIQEVSPEEAATLRFKIYCIENKEKPLGYVYISSDFNNIEVDILETAPVHSTYNSKRTAKYIGETLLSFLATLAKKEGKNLTVEGIAPREKTKDFYFKQCGFKIADKDTGIIPYRLLDNLISQNEKHTGAKIELIG